MELSSELIEIESGEERNVSTRYVAKAACVLVLLVGVVALVLTVGFSGPA
jgi:hypothetical protein